MDAYTYREGTVSTHSHPKVAALGVVLSEPHMAVSTHSHPKVAAARCGLAALRDGVSTHSHPKVAADIPPPLGCDTGRFNTQPPEGGCPSMPRALANGSVSTHSHPKVAAFEFRHTARR